MSALDIHMSLHSMALARLYSSQDVTTSRRVGMTHLSDNAHFPKILEIVQNGAVADTDPEFLKSPRTAPFRDLQRRLTPVYNKHAATMHAANRVLILPIDQLTQSECADLHMANEYHWRVEPGRIAGRPLMDCSNAQPGIIPLNTETTKQMGIARYQTVVMTLVSFQPESFFCFCCDELSGRRASPGDVVHVCRAGLARW